ncbi:MAG: sensor histidine kinase, partial [Planctomycetota bacterium]
MFTRRTIARRPALAALLVAALVAAVIAAVTWPRAERFFAARTSEAATATLALTLEGLRGELARAEPLPGLLAERPILVELLRDPTNEGLLPYTNEQLRQTAIGLGVSDIYLMDTTGLAIAASNYRRDDTFIGRRFDYRPYFTEALEAGFGRFHALGNTSGRRGYFVAAPVLDGTEITGVIAVKITLEDAEESWAAGPMDVLVVDQSNVVFLSNRPDWHFRTLGALP